jgi:hypothetical protein
MIAMTDKTTAAQAKKILHQAETVEQLDALVGYIAKWRSAYKRPWMMGDIIAERDKVEILLTGMDVDLSLYRWIAAGASTDESRPTLVMINVAADLGALVSTDGHRLHILDGCAGRDLAAQIGPGAHKHVKIGKRQVISRKVEDVRYPGYEAIIPDRKRMTGQRYSIEAALSMIKASISEAEEIKKGVVALSEMGDIVNPHHTDAMVLLNVGYVLDALTVGGHADTVTFWVTAKERPIVVDLDKGGLTFGSAVIMPLFGKNVTWKSGEKDAAAELAAILA